MRLAQKMNKIELFSISSSLENIFSRLENFRIKNHLRIVEKELRQTNVDHLSIELQEERRKNINHLNKYWTRGIYPKNVDFSFKMVPYFKDALNTPCAMAYLIEQSGRQDLVDFVAKNNNHVYIKDLQDGPVIKWINKSGLTKKEAARVQPTYAHSTSILLWIAVSIVFIVLEWVSYKNSQWICSENVKRKIVAFLYFTTINSVIALGFFVLASVIFFK
jgi:hypothetical protein